MADSVDRVFVHALNTVKKIPKTGAARPPPANRMRLYGLYKQAMEGDVDGVMDRPNLSAGLSSDDLRREQDKWDAWNAQRGLGRTEAKRRYIETLIDTMHTYATTPSANELVAELEFVWNQIKDNNSPSSSGSFRRGSARGAPYHDSSSSLQRRPSLGAPATDGGPMKMLSPMSEEDEAERETRIRLIEEELEAAASNDDADDNDDDDEDAAEANNPRGAHAARHRAHPYNDDGGGGGGRNSNRRRGSDRWFKMMERAVVKLSAEVAALREQIAAGREFRSRREKSSAAWFGWTVWVLFKHAAVDLFLLVLVLLWMRRRKDRRLEDHVRGALHVLREYVRKILP
ncbi:acyl-binding protein family [Niveomyces insectorum RCEF 264]|uniref:Acyl-binding protein family n=1 Tax=Niveomyces insectorum RCEF 264 TaxID=1081102 RepID=A0A167X1I6_9HYPO|nr:acyl-binding protein family [Niveomyces insectorum RCEF 264]